MIDSMLENNFAFSGGIVYNQNEGLVQIIGSVIKYNLALSGGIIFSINSQNQIKISGGIISENGFEVY